MSSGIVRSRIGLFLLISLITLASCTEKTTTTCPSFDVGAVEGFVTSSGEGIVVTVGARPHEGPQQGELIATVESDETGWYRLELPSNLYRIVANPQPYTVIFSSNSSDTVRVDSHVVRQDLHLGRAELQIAMPAELNGESYRLRLMSDLYTDFNEDFLVEDGLITAVIPALEPGQYTMLLQGPGMLHRFYLPGAFNEDEADTLNVTTDSVALYEADLSERFAFISGQITGSWQEGQTSAPSVYSYVGELERYDSARCTDDGSFVLALIAPAQIRLSINHSSVRRWYGGDSFDEAESFDLEPGDHITDLDVVGSGIELFLSGPGSYISHRAQVLIRHEDGQAVDVTGYNHSRIEVHNLEPGRYTIGVCGHCLDQIWQERWYDGVGSEAEAEIIELAPGEFRRLSMELEMGGRIAGDLLEASGERPARVYCRLHDTMGEPLCADAANVYDGEFSFPGLADGSYLLSVRIDGEEEWWYPGTLDREQATMIEIVNQGEITNLMWSLPESRQGVLR